LVVYLQFEKPTEFFFDYKSSLRDIEKLLKEENPAFLTGVDFYICDGEKDVLIEDKSARFLPLLQYENLKIKAGGKSLAYYV
jgi:hypothetical protein